ncbi:serine/threonine protein kinase [Emergomyces pasteurianus Ep9510]|uniref:Serine/threonine protein kinase n=1 Tax=Emergomyces pasteurianus Ep9510 TaxID=1447872 RepID=A0A1J9PLZ0_9EURO|nr:serine/threonine protein kinase [Emergomyces pasteurianus Ep9510]
MAISIFDRPESPTQQCIPMPNLQKTPPSKRSMWHRLGFPWLGKDIRRSASPGSPNFRDPATSNESSDVNSQSANHDSNHRPRPVSSGVGVGLPRHATFKRQNSEQRDRLYPIEGGFRRALSVDRRRPLSYHRTRTPPPVPSTRLSAPEVQYHDNDLALPSWMDNSPLHTPAHYEFGTYTDGTFSIDGEDAEDMLEIEMDRKWILNLSMHFRDRSEREKFFVTYAETLNKWRRVTVSCDYRNAEPDSLEQDLEKLYYQRDKNARIYESIRDSLPEIQFYDTVTNLRLETSDGRLHVHVTEDINEIIPYPPISTVEYLELGFVRESDLSFVSHLSGFAYQVKLNGNDYVKKEIPGPDMVNEFLYEINALYALIGSQSVIQLKAIVVDDDMMTTKGLLINFAKKGSLVELIYDHRGTIEWARRARWARQIIEGLAEIHEAGFVQGDLTVSNIVVDVNDDAKIIDINRRGCPVGWEAPEFTKLLESKQKISMYIGVKSDLYQLGMTLWALAMEIDEPGSQTRPFLIPVDMKIPDYYRSIVDICLSTSPQSRLPAKELLSLFPQDSMTLTNELAASNEEALAPLPVVMPEDPGCLDENPSRWNYESLEQSANDVRLTSGPNSVPDSDEAVPLYDTYVDPESQHLACEFRDLDPSFAEFENDESPLDFATKDREIELEAPSRADISSAIHSTLAFGSPLGEIFPGTEQHLSCGIECNLLKPDDQYGELQLPEQLASFADSVERGERKICHTPAKGVETTEPLVQAINLGSQYFTNGSQEDLLSSALPINPAFVASATPRDTRHSKPYSEPSTPIEINSLGPQTEFCGQQDPESEGCGSLLLSRLPINPAYNTLLGTSHEISYLCQDLKDGLSFQSLPPNSSIISSLEHISRTQSREAGYFGDLLTSGLPINPAFKDPTLSVVPTSCASRNPGGND